VRATRPLPFNGRVVWLTPEQEGRASGPPATPADSDYMSTAFVLSTSRQNGPICVPTIPGTFSRDADTYHRNRSRVASHPSSCESVTEPPGRHEQAGLARGRERMAAHGRARQCRRHHRGPTDCRLLPCRRDRLSHRQDHLRHALTAVNPAARSRSSRRSERRSLGRRRGQPLRWRTK
jgi:hypothetical protein